MKLPHAITLPTCINGHLLVAGNLIRGGGHKPSQHCRKCNLMACRAWYARQKSNKVLATLCEDPTLLTKVNRLLKRAGRPQMTVRKRRSPVLTKINYLLKGTDALFLAPSTAGDAMRRAVSLDAHHVEGASQYSHIENTLSPAPEAALVEKEGIAGVVVRLCQEKGLSPTEARQMVEEHL